MVILARTHSLSITHIQICFLPVPSSYPVDIMVEPLSPTQVILQWNPVPPIDRNGIITHYEVLFNQSSLTTLPMSGSNINVTEPSATVGPLQPFLNYTSYVRAYTSVGPGPFNPTPITTMTDPSGSVIVFRTPLSMLQTLYITMCIIHSFIVSHEILCTNLY